MALDDSTKDEKLQYDIKTEASKLSWSNINKYEYLTSEKILPRNQNNNNSNTNNNENDNNNNFP